MPLREQFEQSGNWLFRRRSYLPLVLFAVFVPALMSSRHSTLTPAEDRLWEVLCFAVSLLGLMIRATVIGHAPPGTSGRVTEGQCAAVLQTGGIYSVVRHPLYLGNYFMWLGAMLFTRAWWCPVFCSLAFWLYYERIMFAEEEFLRRRFADEWLSWARRTPAFIPALRRWTTPSLPFSFRNVLRREYSGLFGLVASFTLLDIVGDAFQFRRLEFDPIWAVAFAVAVGAYVVLRTLKRQTKVLDVHRDVRSTANVGRVHHPPVQADTARPTTPESSP